MCMRRWIDLHERYAGRLARNVVLTGKVLLNGKKRRLDYGVVVSITYLAMQIICRSCMRFIPNFELSSCRHGQRKSLTTVYIYHTYVLV